MDTQVHKVAVIAGVIAVGVAYIIMVTTLSLLAFTRDGEYAAQLGQAMVWSGGILAVVVVGAPVVLTLAQALGFRVPTVALPPPLPTSPGDSGASQVADNSETGAP